MRNFVANLKIVGFLLFISLIFGFNQEDIDTNNIRIKCLIQATNYDGEGAYFVISLINPSGDYENTLYVQGQDEKWYPSLTQWWDNIGKNEEHIDAISGATRGPGARTICTFEVDKAKMNSGYHIRFESAVEDQEYYSGDVELPLNDENIQGKFEGKGYIRYIRLMAN